jgi:hypothetical protein
METIFNKKTLAITLTAAFVGMTGMSTLAVADEGNSTAAAEPAPASEPAADAATTTTTTTTTTTEEAAPAADAPDAGAE